MGKLRNLPKDSPELLNDLIDIREGRVISMALSKSDSCQIMLLSFGDGESVSEETYFGDTFYYVLEGKMPVYEDGNKKVIHEGECLCVPKGVLHAVGGEGPFKILQITVE